MSAARKYLACAEAGMTVSETARHLRVTPPAVVKAAKAYGITFLRRMPKAPDGRQHPSQPRRKYPFADMEVGDWCRVYSDAHCVARWANLRLPMEFRGHRAGWVERVK